MHCITLKIQLCVMVYMRGFYFVIKILFLSIYRWKSTVHWSQCNDADWANSTFLNHPCFVVTFPILQKKSFLSWELKLAVKEVNYDDETYVMTTGKCGKASRRLKDCLEIFSLLNIRYCVTIEQRVVGGYCTRFCNRNQSADDIDGVQV
ncbi:hypothetical protein OUZ56_024746 [Daphnia magna]|uniref:Uncharacterized protein n=1 Tax=Daphnia magna TaxID=35525 RepID=A0ABQ9ZHV6_9CRUS|nr:hypothetical protein OUZ56_024746 [Daphnia magna]